MLVHRAPVVLHACNRRHVSVMPVVKSSGRFVVAVGHKTLSVPKTMYKMSKAAYRDPAVVSHWMEDIRDSIRHGVKWVKNGFRLFYKNLEISKKLIWKAALGHQLSLRESKLLVTTTTDLFKLVPFSFFIIIPFAELALPVFLRLFPNMLPSTFMEKSFDSAAVARRIRAKKELAEFFHQVIEEKNRQELTESEHHDLPDRAEQLASFRQVMESTAISSASGMRPFPSVKEIVKFGKLFEEEFKLENMDLSHLQQICRMLGIEPFGFKSHVVLQLRHYVNSLQAEDRRIIWEGVDSLTRKELEEACQARGMPITGVPEDSLRVQLDHWLQLSSCREVPVSLLLWSRTCFRLDDQRSPSEQSAKAEEDPEELFEETAERQKERAADVERRLERLELLDSDVSETEIREPAPQIPDDRDELIQRNSKLEEEHALLTQIIEKQERVFAKQLKFLAQMQSLPWLQHVGKEAAVDIRSHLNSAFDDFQSEISEIEKLLERSRGVRMTVDDQRFYPSSDEDEPSDTPPVARRDAGP